MNLPDMGADQFSPDNFCTEVTGCSRQRQSAYTLNSAIATGIRAP